MAVPIAVIACALCLVNLLLTFGVIRRLREHSGLLGPDGTLLAASYDPAALPAPAATP